MRERCTACGQRFPERVESADFHARLRAKLAEHGIESVSCEFGRVNSGRVRTWLVTVGTPSVRTFRVDIDDQVRDASTFAVADGVAERIIRYVREHP